VSTPFNVRAWASQAGIETTGGFSFIAECVTVDELERFAQIAISQYVASQRKEWQGLTDEEINTIAYDEDTARGPVTFARAIEARLKEKNGY
jgi:hypothetical protein